jgi:hypothetical protein
MRRIVCSLLTLGALTPPRHAQSLQEVPGNWRRAVHAEQTDPPALVRRSSQFNQDGVSGALIEPRDGIGLPEAICLGHETLTIAAESKLVSLDKA